MRVDDLKRKNNSTKAHSANGSVKMSTRWSATNPDSSCLTPQGKKPGETSSSIRSSFSPVKKIFLEKFLANSKLRPRFYLAVKLRTHLIMLTKWSSSLYLFLASEVKLRILNVRQICRNKMWSSADRDGKRADVEVGRSRVRARGGAILVFVNLWIVRPNWDFRTCRKTRSRAPYAGQRNMHKAQWRGKS